MKSYKISVIIPIYNAEEYLEEAILSIVNQTIGIEEIQLLLVNDGSPDNSRELCLKYVKLYPENIFYIEKENGGVSSARNVGLDNAHGELIGFLDADDKYAEQALECIYSFYKEHNEEIDVIACRDHFFENTNKYHVLDYKFKKGKRVIDLNDEKNYFAVQSRISAFIKKEAIGDLRFNEGLKYGEDSLFINTIIMEKMRYGVVKQAEYRYRKRSDGSSVVQNQTQNKQYYIDTCEKFYLSLLDAAQKKFDEVKPYIQAVIYYDIGWRLNTDAYMNILTVDEQKKYIALLHRIMKHIDVHIILKNPVHKNFYRKNIAYKLKYGEYIYSKMKYIREEYSYYYKDIKLDYLERNKAGCYIYILDLNETKLRVEGIVSTWYLKATNENVKLGIDFNGERIIDVTVSEYPLKKISTFEGDIFTYQSFKVDIDVSRVKKAGEILRLKPVLKIGNEICPVGMNYGKFVPNTNSFKESYRLLGNICIRAFRTNIQVRNIENIKLWHAKREAKAIAYLIKRKHLDVALFRLKVQKYKRKYKRKDDIWLLCDRVDNAGDNGEVLFKYLCKNKPEGVRPIFVIGKDSPAVERLKTIGEVIFFEDDIYPIYYMLAKKILSSSAGEFVINPFGKDKRFLIDLFEYKYYYLQHGIACADLSGWLNKYNKNIYMFISAAKRERESIINGNYFYNSNQVVLTGQARFDELKDNRKRQILILPTWRRSIKESYDKNTVSVYYEGFKETEYFKFYNSLINNEQLLNTMREYGYKGLFCMHPIHMKQVKDFTENDVFTLNEGYINYNQVFEDSALMVTDYSSVLFDFAYLRKPVVYAQFDKKEFYEGQIYDEGYFEYEKDGFGPVCYDMQSTVNAIISYIEQDCKPDNKYLERVNNFFTFSDQNNCQRIFEAIIEDDEKCYESTV